MIEKIQFSWRAFIFGVICCFGIPLLVHTILPIFMVTGVKYIILVSILLPILLLFMAGIITALIGCQHGLLSPILALCVGVGLLLIIAPALLLNRPAWMSISSFLAFFAGSLLIR